ncbi:hypothetical protein MJG53_003677 [Ovis ammon polii x Ovis aries]|uniref:Uncharacterized protein n=1 Tax=Ovis ammon polii x Ovis aries TaxID=2918886 RepID=A0ACB9VIA6_9CETA|nr:hypothetical protein MJG53_003677 [Ovis ammon polii x Ovis aries]
MGRKGPGVCGCQCCNHGPHPGLGKGGVDFCLHLLKTYGLEGIFRANCHNISGSVSQAASEHLANGKSSPDSSWKPGYHAKAPPQLQGQDLRTAQTFGEQKEAGSLINHQFFRTAFLDFPNAPTSEFLLVFLHPLSRVHAEGLECVKLNSMICRLVFHSGVQHDRGPCESSKTIPQRYKLQGSPAEVPAPYLQRNGGKFHIYSARRNCKINVDIIEENITILRLKPNMSSSCDVSANANNNSDDIVYC